MVSILENRKNDTILTFQNCVFSRRLYVMVSRMSRSNSMVSRRAKLPEILLGTKNRVLIFPKIDFKAEKNVAEKLKLISSSSHF